MARQKIIVSPVPKLTLTVFLVALVVYGLPGLSSFFVYDRSAILNGHFWRLLTAPFVHFSLGHLCWNLIVFAVAGCLIEMAGFRFFWLVCGLAGVVPGGLFLLMSPALEHYGGLSGLATAAVVYFCLCRARRERRNRSLWLLILLLTAIKIFFELFTGAPVFVQTAGTPFRVLPSVHVVGFLSALIAAFIPRQNPMNVIAEVSQTQPLPAGCFPPEQGIRRETGCHPAV